MLQVRRFILNWVSPSIVAMACLTHCMHYILVSRHLFSASPRLPTAGLRTHLVERAFRTVMLRLRPHFAAVGLGSSASSDAAAAGALARPTP